MFHKKAHRNFSNALQSYRKKMERAEQKYIFFVPLIDIKVLILYFIRLFVAKITDRQTF